MLFVWYFPTPVRWGHLLRRKRTDLSGEIPAHFFEAQLLRRYEVPRGQLLKVLNRLASEAMVERKPGQGWCLKDFVHNTQAHIHSYRFRMALEPAALLEPGYQVNHVAFALRHPRPIEHIVAKRA